MVAVLATIFSVDNQVSLWGSYERQFGLMTWLALPVLFLSLVRVLHSELMIDQLWLLLVWTSLPIVSYGLVQALALDPLAWQSDGASAVLSTLGRSNFLGAYLVMIIPLTIGRFFLGQHRWL